MLKWVGRGQFENDEQYDLIILRISVGNIWDFIQAKCSLCWWIERCGGLIWSCCPRSPFRIAGEQKKEAVYEELFLHRISLNRCLSRLNINAINTSSIGLSKQVSYSNLWMFFLSRAFLNLCWRLNKIITVILKRTCLKKNLKVGKLLLAHETASNLSLHPGYAANG